MEKDLAFNKFRVDFEYIVEPLQGFVDFLDQTQNDYDEADFDYKLRNLREIVEEFAEGNPKLSSLLMSVLDEIEANKEKYIGQDTKVLCLCDDPSVDRDYIT